MVSSRDLSWSARRSSAFVDRLLQKVLSDWGEWSECSKTCDGGQTFRTKTVVTESSNGGKPCSGEVKETKACNVGVECYGAVGVLDQDHGCNVGMESDDRSGSVVGLHTDVADLCTA